MGKYDSSSTRVAPVFDYLLECDASGAAWLDRLIGLASGSTSGRPTVSGGQRLVANHGRRWGTDEVSLPPPRQLLEHLVKTITPDQVAASKDTGDTRRNRESLARRDPVTVGQALAALRDGTRGRHWFVLEGDSRPDALIETEDLVICIEGKGSERSCTSTTTWMGARSQLIRQMDAALDAFPAKQVLGLLIVEGPGGPEGITPLISG